MKGECRVSVGLIVLKVLGIFSYRYTECEHGIRQKKC